MTTIAQQYDMEVGLKYVLDGSECIRDLSCFEPETQLCRHFDVIYEFSRDFEKTYEQYKLRYNRLGAATRNALATIDELRQEIGSYSADAGKCSGVQYEQIADQYMRAANAWNWQYRDIVRTLPKGVLSTGNE